ncbi:ATP-binding protein [Streptomyces sp. NPDC058694]|uniref:ATP-binding protein n=1 Tax=Streptomyces sp. NPDC058694 TaxID=3346603 RepID=UPI0036572BD3
MLSNLPDISDEFIGRKPELAHLSDALMRERLVTLIGVGGVGKSRLALHAAHAALRNQRRKVIWVELWPLWDERLLIATVADAAGFADHTATMPLDALCEWLADTDAVLVLDSCEHLLSSCRHLAAHLVMTCPSVTVLATSREPLEMPGEHLVTVEPLPTATDAVELLCRRASAAGASLREPKDVATAARLCQWLEGIPLSLELVAGQLGQRTLREVESTLWSRLDLEAEGEVTGPSRHRAIRTTIGWSHELCEPAERLLWARLSVFRGTVDTETVHAVCGGGPLHGTVVEAALSGLVAKSVVSRGPGGYRMLDTVRDYGQMWLDETGEASGMADRHAGHFLSLARSANRDWLGPRQASWYHAIGRAHPDLCAALDRLLATHPQAALEMSGLLGFFWSCCGRLREVAHYVQASLGADVESGAARARARWALGVARVLRGEYEAAGKLAASSHAEASARQDVEGMLRAAYLEGLIYLLQGRPMTARWLADRELDRAGPTSPASQGRFMCRLVRVFALTAEGQLSIARREAGELYDDCVAIGEWWTRSYAAYQLALIALFEDRTQDAAAHALRILQGKQHLGDSFGIALGLDLLASILAAQGAGEQAVTALGAGETYWGTVGHPQRGTPEMKHVRDQLEQTTRHLLGDDGYDEALRRAARQDPDLILHELLNGTGLNG